MDAVPGFLLVFFLVFLGELIATVIVLSVVIRDMERIIKEQEKKIQDKS
jgi:hypothetical protein